MITFLIWLGVALFILVVWGMFDEYMHNLMDKKLRDYHANKNNFYP